METKTGRARRGTAADDVQMGVRIPKALHDHYIQAVSARGTTQRRFVEDAIRYYLIESGFSVDDQPEDDQDESVQHRSQCGEDALIA